MKRRIIVAIISAITMSMLAGCGQKDSNNQSSEAPIMQIQTGDGEDTLGEFPSYSENPGAEKYATGTDDIIFVKDLDLEQYVSVGEYKGLEVEVSSVAVDDADVEEMAMEFYLSVINEENGGITDRAIEMGDAVVFDYEGKLDGVAFEGGSATNKQLVMGSHEFIDGFEDQMIGHMPGDPFDINVTFPEEYYEELAGKDVVFTITAHYIVPTEMKDEVVAGFGEMGFTTVDELRQYVREYLELSYETQKESEIQSLLLEKLIENSELKAVPEGLLEQYEYNIAYGIESTANSYGVDMDTYCYYYYGMTADQFIQEYGTMAVKQNMFTQYIANVENLNLTDEELEEKLLGYALQSGYTSVDEFVGEQDRESYREYFMFERVMEFLEQNAVITEK